MALDGFQFYICNLKHSNIIFKATETEETISKTFLICERHDDFLIYYSYTFFVFFSLFYIIFFYHLNLLIFCQMSILCRRSQHSKQSTHQAQNHHNSQYQPRQIQHNHGHNNHNHGHRHRGRGRAHYRRHFDRVRQAESTPRWQWAREKVATQVWSDPLFDFSLSVYNILISISSIIYVNVIYGDCLSSNSFIAINL